MDDGLREFATETQARYMDAVKEHGTYRKAAAKLGISHTTIIKSLAGLRRRAARQGYSPDHDMTHTVPDGFRVRGVSTYYDAEGKPRGQWVKSNIDHERQLEIMRDVIDGMASEIPREALVTPPAPGNSDLLNCFVITDFHLGALSWEPETGADWGVAIAEKTITEWLRQAIAQSPKAETAVLAQLSDFLHWDGFDAVTPINRHLLDADGRFPNLARVSIRILRNVIATLLNHHSRVHIIMADANHDPVSQVWLREWIAILYENEPRITVDTSPSPYNCYEFGNTALFFHHGHKRKPTDVSDVFVANFREVYGRTKHAYAHMGHLHHIDVKENNLMVVEQHRTLAAPDAYTARGGWVSGRDAKVITYHREYGEVGRITVSYDMVASSINSAL